MQQGIKRYASRRPQPCCLLCTSIAVPREQRPQHELNVWSSCRPQRLFSTMCTREDLFPRALSSVPVTDFFGGAAGSRQIAAAFGAGAPPAAGPAAQQPDAAQHCREWGSASVGCHMGSGGASCGSQDAEQMFTQLWQQAQNQTRDVIQTPLASCGDCLILLLVLAMLGAAAAVQRFIAM